LTAGSAGIAGSTSLILSYDEPVCSQVVSANSAMLNGTLISVLGGQFKSVLHTVAARMPGTCAEASSWKSDSSMHLRVSFSTAAHTCKFMLTAGLGMSSLSDVFSYDIPVVRRYNTSTEERAIATVLGDMFGVHGTSVKSALGHSQCEATTWSADTRVTCLIAAGALGNHTITVTSGMHVGCLSYGFTYIAPFANVPIHESFPAVDGMVSVFGRRFGDRDYTQQVRVGGSACVESRWL
jgi:hypothetical protein